MKTPPGFKSWVDKDHYSRGRQMFPKLARKSGAFAYRHRFEIQTCLNMTRSKVRSSKEALIISALSGRDSSLVDFQCCRKSVVEIIPYKSSMRNTASYSISTTYFDWFYSEWEVVICSKQLACSVLEVPSTKDLPICAVLAIRSECKQFTLCTK